MSKIFISYSRADSDFVDKIDQGLEQRGFDVWVDRADIGGGSAWRAEIAQAIRDCDAFLLIFSPRAAASTNISKELALADKNEKRIFPVVLEHSPVPESMEYQLAGLQQMHFESGRFSEGFQRLLDALPPPAGGLIEPPEQEELPEKPPEKEKRNTGSRRRMWISLSIVVGLLAITIAAVSFLPDLINGGDDLDPYYGQDDNYFDEGNSSNLLDTPADGDSHLHEKPGIYMVEVPGNWSESDFSDFNRTMERFISPDDAVVLDIEIGAYNTQVPDGVIMAYYPTWEANGTFFFEYGRRYESDGWVVEGEMQNAFGATVSQISMLLDLENGVNSNLLLLTSPTVSEAARDNMFEDIRSSFVVLYGSM